MGRSTKVLNIFISLGGLFFITLCIIAFLCEDLISTNAFITILLLLLILLGCFVINTAILLTKKSYQLFMGLLLAGWGILLYLMHFVLPYTMFQMWPLFLVLAGCFLLASGIFRYKKFKYGFEIPAVTLILMGIWYFLFSFKIITISFSLVAEVLGPVFMLCIAIFLIIFFFAQKKHSELIVQDESKGDFEDEEFEHPRLGR